MARPLSSPAAAFAERIAALQAFKREHPLMVAWMQAHPEEPLADTMQRELGRRGKLTPRTFRAVMERIR